MFVARTKIVALKNRIPGIFKPSVLLIHASINLEIWPRFPGTGACSAFGIASTDALTSLQLAIIRHRQIFTIPHSIRVIELKHRGWLRVNFIYNLDFRSAAFIITDILEHESSEYITDSSVPSSVHWEAVDWIRQWSRNIFGVIMLEREIIEVAFIGVPCESLEPSIRGWFNCFYRLWTRARSWRRLCIGQWYMILRTCRTMSDWSSWGKYEVWRTSCTTSIWTWCKH